MENKAIMISAKPKECANILNLIQSVLARKKFHKDYVGWVYIYCTKGEELLTFEYASVDNTCQVDYPCGYNAVKKLENNSYIKHEGIYNGKVVARFWCDKVSVIQFNSCPMIPTIAYTTFLDKYYSDTDLQKASCLNGNELMWYLGTDKEQVGYAIHITKLEVFGIPKELKEFYYFGYKENLKKKQLEMELAKDLAKDFYQRQMQFFNENWHLKRAPQNYCYIEAEE